ncbi:MAG: hypothetical protein JW748_03150 [Anaerolineales bacterium]|nr:hypothetical protein [Anaerolineales bacterium]
MDSIIPTVPPTTDDRELQYLIIGHVTKDIAPEGERMGGTAAYAGLTALAYGAFPLLVTSCSLHGNLSPLDGMLIHKVLSGRETTFENRYNGSTREQWVRSVAEPLGEVHIPRTWSEPEIVHLAPVVGEVKPGLMDLFLKSLCCVTLQGWMRDWDDDGRVHRILSPDVEQAARNAHVSVFSMDDIGGDEALAAGLAALSPVSAVTDGERGCRISRRGETRVLPAPKVTVVDPTGAGDIFAAVFFLRLKETGDAWEAGRMATALASLSVTRPGLAGVPTRDEILEAKRTGTAL